MAYITNDNIPEIVATAVKNFNGHQKVFTYVGGKVVLTSDPNPHDSRGSFGFISKSGCYSINYWGGVTSWYTYVFQIQADGSSKKITTIYSDDGKYAINDKPVTQSQAEAESNKYYKSKDFKSSSLAELSKMLKTLV